LATIDQELDFLKFLKQTQPPYLDAIYLLAKSAPQGTHLEELSLSRHREISLRLKMANAQQVSDFRAKLIDSGWFANVMVEEQSPSPDRRVAVRMTAELKPVESRKPLTAELPGKKTAQSRSGGEEQGLARAPPQAVIMPPLQPMELAAEATPAPPPDRQDSQTPPAGRRRVRKPTTPEP